MQLLNQNIWYVDTNSNREDKSLNVTLLDFSFFLMC